MHPSPNVPLACDPHYLDYLAPRQRNAEHPFSGELLREADKKAALDLKSIGLTTAAVTFGVTFRSLLKRHLPINTRLFKAVVGEAFDTSSQGVMGKINLVLHHAGQIAIPAVAIEWGTRKYCGYDDSLSFVGSLMSIALFQRVAIQYVHLDRSGMNIMLVVDRFFDLLAQVQSGESWGDTDFTKPALRYGTISLFGQMRMKWGRDLIFRVGSRLGLSRAVMRGVSVQHGSLKTGMFFFRKDSVSDKLFQKLFASMNINSSAAYLAPDGRIISPALKKVRASLTAQERGALSRLFGKEKFEELFAVEKRMLKSVAMSDGSNIGLLPVVLSADISNLGIGLFILFHEGQSWFIDAALGHLFRGEDFWEVAEMTAWKGFLFMPPRYLIKFRKGFDKGAAILWERGIKIITEPVLTKFFPIYTSKGLWRKGYQERVMECESLDDFLDIHLGPKLWGRGGLVRYNWRAFLPVNLINTILPGHHEVDPKAKSPYDLIPVSYAQLAKLYEQSVEWSPEARERLERWVGRLLLEAQVRKRTNDLNERKTLLKNCGLFPANLSRYDDETVIQQAVAISHALHLAHQKRRGHYDALFNTYYEHVLSR